MRSIVNLIFAQQIRMRAAFRLPQHLRVCSQRAKAHTVNVPSHLCSLRLRRRRRGRVFWKQQIPFQTLCEQRRSQFCLAACCDACLRLLGTESSRAAKV